MNSGGPPRKVFRPSGSEGPRPSYPGSQPTFTADHGAFRQPSPGQVYLPPPPMEGPHYTSSHGHSGARGVHPSFRPYIPPQYARYPVPPMCGAFPQRWHQGHGYRGHRGRGRGWGRYGGSGPRGRGGRYPQTKQRDESGNVQLPGNIDAYYSMTMFEDPWKDLLPREDPTSMAPATTAPDATDSAQQGANTDDDHEQTVAVTELTDTVDDGKGDHRVEFDGHHDQTADDNGSGHASDLISERTILPQSDVNIDIAVKEDVSSDSRTENCD